MSAFRRMLPVDRAFVISAWSSSMRTSKTAGLISMARWAAVMHLEIGALLANPRNTTIVAFAPGEYVQTLRGPMPFHYGFLAIGEPVTTARGTLPYVLYCYVKARFRRGRSRFGTPGYASQLLLHVGIDPRAPFAYACSTGVVGDLATKIPLAEFNPLPARFQESDNDQSQERDARNPG